MRLQHIKEKEGVRVKQTVNSTALSKRYIKLTSENRDQVLAVARALAFAQEAQTEPPPGNEPEPKKKP